MNYTSHYTAFMNKDLFTRAAANSTDLIFVTDHQRKILYVNDNVSLKTGYQKKELLEKKFYNLCPKKCRASCTSKMSKALREAGKWKEEIEIQKKDGATFWAKVTVSAYHNDIKKVAGFVCIVHDLSERRTIARQAWETENILQQIIDSMSDALFVVDASGTILMCNSAHARIVSYTKDKIVGVKPPYPWLQDDEKDKMREALNVLRKENTLNNYPISWRRENGSRLFASLAGSRFGGNTKKDKRYVITVRDVSDVPREGDYRRTNARFEMLMSEIKRKAVVLRVLNEINCFVLRNEHVSKVFKAIVSGVKELVTHDLAGFYIYNEAQQVLMPHTLSKQTSFSRKLAKLPLPLGKGIIGAVAASGKMAWVNNAQMDPRSRYPEGMKPTTEHFIAAPMMGRDRLFGVLVVARNSAPEFVEEEAQLIDLFAHAATVALENARLYSTLDSQQNNGKDSESFKALDKSIVM